MKININQNSVCLFLVSIFIFLFSCQLNNEVKDECLKYADEKYAELKTDTALVVEANKNYKYLLTRFDENPIEGLNHEAYRLLFYSSFAYGKIIKFEKGNNSWSLSVKCHNYNDAAEECKEYQIGIDKEEWDEFEKMVYEFNFWTAEDFRATKNVLDGYVFFLEGNRPEAKKCKKKTYKLVGRGSPRYDRMDALCHNILAYENQIKFRYEQLNKIK